MGHTSVLQLESHIEPEQALENCGMPTRGKCMWAVLEVWLHEWCWRCGHVPGSVQHWGQEVGVVVGGECSLYRSAEMGAWKKQCVPLDLWA